MKKLLMLLVGGVVALPIAAIVTILLSPFWGWIEATFGIESLGHSGPADWCFLAVYLLMLVVGLGTRLLLRKKNAATRRST